MFTDASSLESTVETISRPKRPQDKVFLTEASKAFSKVYKENTKKKIVESKVEGTDFKKKDGDIVIAAITSAQILNPNVLIGAGLLAENAFDKGLKVKPWVKLPSARLSSCN